MEQMGFCTLSNLSDVLELLVTVHKLNNKLSEEFGFYNSSLFKKIVNFPLDRCYTFSMDNFFSFFTTQDN